MGLLTAEEQKKVEELAGYFFSPPEIALIMGLDVNEFKDTRLQEPDFIVPFKRGKLLKESEIRKAVIQLAVNGSSPAQALAVQFIDKSNINEISV